MKQTEQTKGLVAELLEKFAKAKSIRANWTTYWEEIARFVQPRKNDAYGFRAKGDKRGDELLDSTGIHSNELLASALHSMLTNPAVPWFGITTGNEDLDADDEARAWLSDSTRVMINVLNNSNFQTEIHELYLDEGSFGTGSIFTEEDDVDVVRFQTRSIFELYALENFKGIIDTIFREFKLNYSQIIGEFGDKWCDEETLEQIKKDPYTQEFDIIHCILPRKGYNPLKAQLPSQYEFASYYVFKDKNVLLAEGGYQEMPFAIPRWTKIAGEVYGRSPAMKALPDIKMLNKMMEVTIKAAQLQVAPPIAVPDDGFILPVKMQPFGITYYRSGTQDDIKPLFQNMKLDLSREMILNTREKIQQAFFIDQLQLRNGPQMTATEVNQRTEEQLRLLGPILGRQDNELLKPLISRVFNICLRRKLFKKVPAILSKKKIDFIYASQIAKVQRTAEVSNISKVINSVAPIIQANPEALDIFDPDAVIRYASRAYMLPAELIRSSADLKQLRTMKQQALEKRAQDEENMRSAEMANKVAPMMNMGGEGGM